MPETEKTSLKRKGRKQGNKHDAVSSNYFTKGIVKEDWRSRLQSPAPKGLGHLCCYINSQHERNLSSPVMIFSIKSNYFQFSTPFTYIIPFDHHNMREAMFFSFRNQKMEYPTPPNFSPLCTVQCPALV